MCNIYAGFLFNFERSLVAQGNGFRNGLPDLTFEAVWKVLSKRILKRLGSFPWETRRLLGQATDWNDSFEAEISDSGIRHRVLVGGAGFVSFGTEWEQPFLLRWHL